jgi:hypothetical protein
MVNKKKKNREEWKKTRGRQRTSFFHSIFVYRLTVTRILIGTQKKSRGKEKHQGENLSEMIGNAVLHFNLWI